ncbi:hypothetical protein EV421DRAFT_1825102 [Armillaria borealis]|uniref:Uncharacterized protein n=1 Tax=Armillaria borealis TaxID=47425 RepID=A0AA39MLW3_9AGAR|nr:hypothetical protein EV421DRAFT_1825102 [Armillaria borealis]
MIRIWSMKMVRILYNVVAMKSTYSRIGAPTVRQDNIFPPSICKENSGKKHACMRSELAPAIGALLLPMMHLAHIPNVLWRTASSFEPQVFTHASPCRFYLPLFLAGVRSANVVNLRVASLCLAWYVVGMYLALYRLMKYQGRGGVATE